MIHVCHGGGLVVLDLGGRVRDVLMGMLQAERFGEALDNAATLAEQEPPTLYRGDVWELRVLSFDRRVTIRFWPPHGMTATRVPLPPKVARQLADRVRFARQQAAYGIRFETPNAVV